ncbi:hypothetical protein SEA_SCHMIDT_53 [Gordonia phage Schmidt]|uniref:Uncharacterized protein n=1 Tax=Gordonia phage Schmidt TaxID=2301697 RepID=A0A385E078_9CAUD|nr:hypothetical protein KDJ59_gp53 [Gordonia phage Schmidt]AXQ65173.1 hypothetical protein SEA_SCHMIDT_53 [Gordonia phage Schmidt]
MKTRKVEQYEVRTSGMSPVVIESREQLDRFMEAAQDLEGVAVRRREVTVTETDWEEYRA